MKPSEKIFKLKYAICNTEDFNTCVERITRTLNKVNPKGENMKEKFIKASNERLLKWINKACAVLISRGYSISFHASTR